MAIWHGSQGRNPGKTWKHAIFVVALTVGHANSRGYFLATQGRLISTPCLLVTVESLLYHGIKSGRGESRSKLVIAQGRSFSRGKRRNDGGSNLFSILYSLLVDTMTRMTRQNDKTHAPPRADSAPSSPLSSLESSSIAIVHDRSNETPATQRRRSPFWSAGLAAACPSSLPRTPGERTHSRLCHVTLHPLVLFGRLKLSFNLVHLAFPCLSS